MVNINYDQTTNNHYLNQCKIKVILKNLNFIFQSQTRNGKEVEYLHNTLV